MIGGNLSTFNGLPVQDFKVSGDIADLGATVPRVRCDYDDKATLPELLGNLLAEPGVERVRGLVLGQWREDGEAIDVTPRESIELLVANKGKLPRLEALFVGDIISEENEMSWIQNADLSPVWAAFPKLVEFGVRGQNGLRLGKINHATLKKLSVQTGGLPAAVAREALEANAPLTHFELWFGTEEYGLSTSIDDLRELLSGALFPKLTTLALRNCDFANEIAKQLARSPLLDRIDHLDLSMGTLSDEGAAALAASGKLARLKSVNIEHHYVSDAMRTKLAAATPNLIADEAEVADSWGGTTHYYVSVSE